MSMVDLTQDDILRLIELREAAREVYASAGVLRMQGTSLIRSDMAIQRLQKALEAVDSISFRPVITKAAANKPKATKAVRK